MCVNSIDSASVTTKVFRTTLHRPTLPDLIAVEDQVVVVPPNLPYPDTEAEPVVQLRLLRKQHLKQDALEEI